MSITNLTPTVSAYRRITVARCDIKITHQRHTYRLKLMKDAEVVASIECSRTGNLSAAGALEKARLNAFGPTSSVYKAMQQLADIAEGV
jgi:hypothetical protein